jgi:hypothetical protein
VPDQALPELVGRALMHNSAAIIELPSVQEKLRAQAKELEEMHEQYAAMTHMQVRSLYPTCFLLLLTVGSNSNARCLVLLECCSCYCFTKDVI